MEEESNFESTYRAKLESLAENKKITEEQLSHFLRRWVQVISPSRDFGLEALGKITSRNCDRSLSRLHQ